MQELMLEVFQVDVMTILLMALVLKVFYVACADHMMAMKMINQAHARKGKVVSFVSYCGGLPSPAAANNPLAYKFRYECC